MHRLEGLGSILAAHVEDRVRSTRVLPDVLGEVVDLAIEGDP